MKLIDISILQKKTPGRYSFDRPDYADITVGGHYQAGETIPDGVREVHEELGLLALDKLYLRLFVAARRFCAGERTHVFW